MDTCPCPVDHGPADDDELTDSLEHYRRRYVTGVDDELEPLTRIADIDPAARARLVDILERRILRRP